MDVKKISETITHTTEDAEGNITTQTTHKEKNISYRNPEPDYIKIYTNMWLEFNQIPLSVRPLFYELAIRMTYADASNPESSQLVYTMQPVRNVICQSLNIKDNMFSKHLNTLVKCNAIRKISRGVYQINPQYAGRGEWRYNPRLKRGGLENLIAYFNFKEKDVKTKVIWASDDEKALDGEPYDTVTVTKNI